MPDDNDIQIHTYQDDLTTDDNAIDPIMDEETEDPAEEIGIPRDEFKEELDKLDFGDHLDKGDDDRREAFEDQEENIGNAEEK